jgi:G3E family GTPase
MASLYLRRGLQTSGVTDPAAIVAALDQRFGRLARARLDSVVAVVDADLLSQITTAGD